jgi:hypothetical protein
VFGYFTKKVAERFTPIPKTVVDLDAIVTEAHYVRFQGQTHKINPVDVASFFVLANGWAEVRRLLGNEKVGVDEVVNAYWGVINPVCSTITKEMIRSATNAQVDALLKMVQDCVSGRMTDEKKKLMTLLPLSSL